MKPKGSQSMNSNSAQTTSAVMVMPSNNGALAALLPFSNASSTGLTTPSPSSASTLNDLKQRFEQVQLNSAPTIISMQQTQQTHSQSINGASSSLVNKANTINKLNNTYMSLLASNNSTNGGGVCNSESSSPIHQTINTQTNQQQPLSSLSFSSSSSSNFSLSPSSSSSWSSNSSSLSNVLLPSSLAFMQSNNCNSINTTSNFNAIASGNSSSGASTSTLNNMNAHSQTTTSAPTHRSCLSGSASMATRHSLIHLNSNHTQQQSPQQYQTQPNQRQSLQEVANGQQTTTSNSVLAVIAQIHKNANQQSTLAVVQPTVGVQQLQLKELTKTAIINSTHSSISDKYKQQLQTSPNSMIQIHQQPIVQPSASSLLSSSMVSASKKPSASVSIASCSSTTTTNPALNKLNTSSTHGCNWVPLRHHTAKCNIMLRKMRRGAKRSKSLPSRFK
jgi:hypothetical protein